tara:strand:- start:1492 stop:1902 length:411 start_codon:yes stop_codon:yes gene_type:complete
MKLLKPSLLFVFILFFISCSAKIETSSDAHPNFKIGKTGFEKSLKAQFDFEKLSVGTYFTKKNGISTEKGLNLTFQKNSLSQVSDSLIYVYSDEIKIQVKKYLLNLDKYNYINIKFEEQKKGDITRSNIIEFKKEL